MDPTESPLPAAESLFQWPQWASRRGDAVALIFESPRCGSEQPAALVELTWRELAVAVRQLATELQRAGFVPGDRLVHALGNSGPGVLIALASMAIGTIEVPIDPLLDRAHAEKLAQLVEGRWYDETPGWQADTTATGVAAPMPATVAASEAAIDALWQLHAQRDLQEPSLILFTSGTGGKSKAVTLSRRNLASNAAAKLQAVPQSCHDVRLCVLPICHAYARTCDLGTWLLSGCTLAVSTGWEGWRRVAPLVRPMLVNTVPSVAARLLGEAAGESTPPDRMAIEASRRAWRVRPEVSRLRLLGCGGAALPVEEFHRFAEYGVTVIQGYGMTESSPVICSATPQDARPGWVGRPVDGWQTRVDHEGRLWVRGDGVMLGYWNDPEETSRRVVDRWLDTGDLVQVDSADGQFRIVGRIDDRITLPNARKIHPAPIEQRVLGLAGVLHAVLVPSGRHLELWIDVQPPWRSRQVDWETRVGNLLSDLPRWQRPRRVLVLAKPLAETPGALTRKGTPVRGEVIRRCLVAWQPDDRRRRDEAGV